MIITISISNGRNHDILWMGAASGNEACMANVIRLSMRYGNLGTLEDGYGINLLPLATFAMDTYADDPCTIFAPKTNFADSTYNEKTLRLITQMHKAITIIQFKLEANIINRRPEFGMGGQQAACRRSTLNGECLSTKAKSIRCAMPTSRP